MPIRQLAPDVAAKIAAGEVVERPASVVKELIENSIDAGATQLRVDLVNGGLQLIRVTDNGSGIPVDELPLALARHATSKVFQIDDLEHIRSLGFRGEALASIAAVAEITLVSHHRSATQGAQIGAVNGQISELTAAASPEGTIVTVRNLFSAVPARLKFLKSRNIEISHCHHLLEQYALAYPEIRFSVFSEGRLLFATPGNGQLSSVLVEVYGLQVAEQMVPIQSAEHTDNSEYPIVSGYVSRPTCYKSTRQHISFFVNRRWVLSRILTAAVEKAYQTLLLTGRHPIAVINLQLDPTLLDVNVHPAKTEIRFLKESRVFSTILRAVRSALLEEPEMPHWQSRQARQEQSLPADTPNNVGAHFIAPSIPTIPATPNTPVPPNEDDELLPFPQDNPWLTVTEEETGTKPPMLSRLWQSHVRHSEPERPEQRPAQNVTQSSEIHNIHASEAAITARRHEAPLNSNNDLTSDTINVSHRLPRLRVVGQLSQSYIVTEGEDGMYLIDQHAAHERILLERMVAAMKAQAPISQHLLTPLTIELAPNEIEALEDHQQQLTHIGFALELPDGKTLLVQAVPSVLVKHMNARSLHELLIDLTAPENLGHTETWEERALANVACKAAIKANYFLTTSEMREMLEQLEQTQAPYSCCHGRPTMIHFSLSALEREFGRR